MPDRLFRLQTPCGTCGGALAELAAGPFGAGRCRYCRAQVSLGLLQRWEVLWANVRKPRAKPEMDFVELEEAPGQRALTSFEQLRLALSDTRGCYERGARELLSGMTPEHAVEWGDVADAARQLAKGLLVKLFVHTLHEPALESPLEASMIDLLMEQLGGPPSDRTRTWGQLRAIEPDLELDVLLRPFERVPEFRRHVALLLSHSNRVVNLIVKFDRRVSAEELARARAIGDELSRRVERFARPRGGSVAAGRAPVDTASLEQLRTDGRWVRRQLAAVDAANTSLVGLPARSVEDVLRELDALVGVEEVKRDLHGLVAVLRARNARRELALPEVELCLHACFVGNPGLGQGTVAAILGRACAALGVLPRGQLLETSGLELAQGESIVRQRLLAAEQGVLLVHAPSHLLDARDRDAAADLAWQCFASLISREQRALLLVFADDQAGIERVLAELPELAPRVRHFTFPDYTSPELGRVLECLVKSSHFRLSSAARLELCVCLHHLVQSHGALRDNASALREAFLTAVERQARRVIEHPGSDLSTFEPGDFVFEGVPEAVRTRVPRFVRTSCVQCGAQGRLPSRLLGTRIQCRGCRHEMFADWGVPAEA